MRPFDDADIGRRLLPLAFGIALAFGLLWLPPHRPNHGFVLAAAVLTAGVAAAIVVLPWPRLATSTHALPAFASFVVVVLLRHAEGGAGSGYAPLVMLPFLWIALYGSVRQFVVAIIGVAVVFVGPIVLIGAPEYPSTEWRRALLWLTVAATMGVTVRDLVRRVRALAATDALTGLANRRALYDRLGASIERARRAGTPLCVAMVDIDHFKQFNDARGHLAGDDLLRRAAATWRDQARAFDFLARYGGEEFCLVLDDTDLDDATAVVERLRASLPESQTASAGLSQWQVDDTAEQLVQRADRALYRAKDNGRNRLVVEGPEPELAPG